MIRVVAVLETMWDWKAQTSSAGYKQAPRFFRINPRNFSGRRLYKLVGPNAHLLVTESCRELVSAAHKHGTPDPEWLRENLLLLEPFEVLLLCGKVAQQTFLRSEHPTAARIVEMPHPAARAYWTAKNIETTKDFIQQSALPLIFRLG